MVDTIGIYCVLRKCGHTENNKRNAYMFYKKNKPSNKEFAAYLKKAYGIGGSSPAYKVGDMNKGDAFEMCWSWDTCGYIEGKKAKGLVIKKYRFEKNDDPEGLPYKSTTIEVVDVPWTEVAEMTAFLIDTGTFMDAKDFCTNASRWNLRKLIWVQ